ncbi:MAG: hypothetical protein WC471_05820 [Candidatus Woesearchaeota archaeon]
MKKEVAFIITALLCINIVSAVGIKWFTEGEVLNENSDLCIRYGTYNPSGNDIKVNIAVEGELQSIIEGVKSSDSLVEASTSSINAKMIDFCFKVPIVYPEDCLWNGLICEQKCEVETKTYSGEVVMTEAPAQTTGGTAGSGATIAASAPLKLTVNCKAHKRDWSIVYVTLILLVLVILGVLIYRKYRKPKLQRYKEELKALQDKLKKEQKKK